MPGVCVDVDAVGGGAGTAAQVIVFLPVVPVVTPARSAVPVVSPNALSAVTW